MLRLAQIGQSMATQVTQVDARRQPAPQQLLDRSWHENLATVTSRKQPRQPWQDGADVLIASQRRRPSLERHPYLQQTSITLEEASANLGASAMTTARRITLPLILANLIAGAMLAFAFSMLEVSDSIMLAQRQDYWPITKTIYELFQLIGTGKYIAAALGVWAMAFLAATILAASLLLGRKMGPIFRV